MSGPFELISETASGHYRASLARQGYSEADFELTQRVDPPPRSTTDSWGFVIVTCKLAGIERRYRAGPSLSWTDVFDADVRRGVYLAASAHLPPQSSAIRKRAPRFLNNSTDGNAYKDTPADHTKTNRWLPTPSTTHS